MSCERNRAVVVTITRTRGSEPTAWGLAAILKLQSVPLVSFRKKTGRASYCKKSRACEAALATYLTLSAPLLWQSVQKKSVSGSVTGRQMFTCGAGMA